MKVLILTNKLEIITAVSNYINLNINNKISILIANNIKAATSMICEQKIDLIIWESEMFDLVFLQRKIKLFANNFHK